MASVKLISGCWEVRGDRVRCEPKYYRADLCKDVVVGDRVYVVGLDIEFTVAAVEARASGKVWYTPAEGSIVTHPAESKTESEQQLERSWNRTN